MKNFILFAVLLFSTSAYSQFSFTNTFNPIPGNNYSNADADTTNIYEGNAGTNQFWNFSALSQVGENYFASFVSPGSTPGGSSYPSSTVASGFSDSVSGSYYVYYLTSGTELTILGSSVSSSTASYNIVFNNPMTFFSYPLNYNQTISDSYSGSTTATLGGVTGILKRKGTISITYDAYGTIVLPSGTVTNAARIKMVQSSTDSLQVGQFTVSVTSTTSTSYQWYKQNYKFSLMDITYTTTQQQGQTFHSKDVSFVPNGATVGISSTTSTVMKDYKLYNNYPNPFNPLTNIKFTIPKEGFTSLEIFNSSGIKVTELISQAMPAGEYSYLLDASNLSSGIYFYRLKSGNFDQTKKMMLVK